MICGPRCVEIGVWQCVVSVARPLRRARSGGGWGESSLGGELGSKRGGIGGNMSLLGFPVSYICVGGKNCKNCECLLLQMSENSLKIFQHLPGDS